MKDCLLCLFHCGLVNMPDTMSAVSFTWKTGSEVKPRLAYQWAIMQKSVQREKGSL